jgi:hypothetical protein
MRGKEQEQLTELAEFSRHLFGARTEFSTVKARPDGLDGADGADGPKRGLSLDLGFIDLK